MTALSANLLAADPGAGCHGQDGNAQYLVAAMKAYKDGSRTNPIMKPMVEALSDADIENIAAYYASLIFSFNCYCFCGPVHFCLL